MLAPLVKRRTRVPLGRFEPIPRHSAIAAQSIICARSNQSLDHHVQTRSDPGVNTFLLITFLSMIFPTGHIGMKNSSDSKLLFHITYSQKSNLVTCPVFHFSAECNQIAKCTVGCSLSCTFKWPKTCKLTSILQDNEHHQFSFNSKRCKLTDTVKINFIRV